MDYIIQIKVNKSWGSDSSPRFTLKLNGKTSEDQKRKNNYDVLSKLIGSSDVIIELNGSLLNLPTKKRDSYASKFIEDVKALGVEYRCSKVPSVSIPSLLNLFGNRTAQEQVITAYIPNEIWQKTEVKNLLSFYGARYIVLKERSDASEMLDYFQKMLENEQVDYFKLIAYNVMCLNAMGIFTNYFDLSNIKTILGIS